MRILDPKPRHATPLRLFFEDVFSASISQTKAMLILVFLLIACFFSSITDIRYLISGQSAQATIVSITKNRKPEKKYISSTTVTYTFADHTTAALRTETDTIAGDWPDKDAKAIEVQYIPTSPGTSRAAVKAGLSNIILFLVLALITAVCTPILAGYYRHRAYRLNNP